MRLSISINGLRLPGHFNSMLRCHINGYHLRSHIELCFGCNDAQWSIVNHSLFGLHFRSLSSCLQVQQMKFVYDQQPLGARTSRYCSNVDPSTIDRCPCCSLAREDRTHFLQCPHNPSYDTVLREFQISLHSRNLHAIFYLMSFGILHWMAGEVPPSTAWDLRGYPPHMHADILTALHPQDSIGWLSCFKGFLSSHSTVVAGLLIEDPTVKSRDKSNGRLRHVMTSLHKLSLAIWKGRNNSVHRADTSTDQQLHRHEDLEIQHYHNHPEMLSVSDRGHYCERPLQKILRSTPANRRCWHRQVKLSHSRRLMDLQSQSLTPQYFHRIPLIPTPTVALDHAPPPLPAPPPRQRNLLEFFLPKSSMLSPSEK